MKTQIITSINKHNLSNAPKHFNYTLAFNQILQDLEQDFKAGLITVTEFAERKDQFHNFLNGSDQGTTTISEIRDLRKGMNPTVKDQLFKKLNKGITVCAGSITGKLESKTLIDGKMFFILTGGVKICVEDVKSIRHDR